MIELPFVPEDDACRLPIGIELAWKEAESFIDLSIHRVAVVRGDADEWVGMVVSVPGGKGLVAGEPAHTPYGAITTLIQDMADRRDIGMYP